jgi:Protein of unknown function (DUF2627)
MCVPGYFAIYGFTRMKDILFDTFAGQPFPPLPFLEAFALFLAGLGLLAGFLFHHDKKRNKIQPKLLGKEEEPGRKRKPGY